MPATAALPGPAQLPGRLPLGAAAEAVVAWRRHPGWAAVYVGSTVMAGIAAAAAGIAIAS